MSDNGGCVTCCLCLNLLLNFIICVVIAVCGTFYLIGETKNDNRVSNMTEMGEELKSHIATTEAFMSSVNQQLDSINKTINSLQESSDTLHSSINKNTQMIEKLNETTTKGVAQIRDSMLTIENNTATILNITRMNTDLTQQSINTIVDVNRSLVEHIQRIDIRVLINGSQIDITKLIDYHEEITMAVQSLQNELTQLITLFNITANNTNKTLCQIEGTREETLLQSLLVDDGFIKTMVNNTNEIATGNEEKLQQLVHSVKNNLVVDIISHVCFFWLIAAVTLIGVIIVVCKPNRKRRASSSAVLDESMITEILDEEVTAQYKSTKEIRGTPAEIND